MVEPIDIRTGKPFVSRRCHEHHPPSDGASLGGMSGRARGLMGGCFMGTMMASQSQSLPYDYEVEYLDSTGTQYINTGIVVQDKLPVARWKSQRLDLGLGGSSYGEFGMWASNNRRFQMFREDFGIGSLSSKFSVDMNAHEYLMDSVNLIARRDKVTYTGFDMSNGFGDTPLYLFSRSGTADNPRFIGRYYWCKIWDRDLLLIDLIPVVSTIDGVQEACMYDRVSGQFFRNAGTGSFIAGPRV